MFTLYPDNLQSLLDASSLSSNQIGGATPEQQSTSHQSFPASPRCVVPKRRTADDEDGQSELTDDFTAKRAASSPDVATPVLSFMDPAAMLASFQVPTVPQMPAMIPAMPFFSMPSPSQMFTPQFPGFGPAAAPFFAPTPNLFMPGQQHVQPPFNLPYLPNPFMPTCATPMPVPITSVPTHGLKSHLLASDAAPPGQIDPVAVKVLTSQSGDAPHSNSIQGRAPNKVLTYAALITMAIMTLPGHRAKIHDIYRFIETHRFMVPDLPDNWKLSVRHNLSSRDCFLKITDGCSARNSWWGINEAALPMAAKLVADLENLRSSPATTA